MAQQIKAFATISDDLSLILGTHLARKCTPANCPVINITVKQQVGVGI